MAITREELFQKLNVIRRGPYVDPFTKRAYDNLELRLWKTQAEQAPHGYEWHTSLHASSFPGGSGKRCGREAMYTLMNIPAQEPVSAMGRSIMEAGKGIEYQVVYRWGVEGILISGSVPLRNGWDFKQTGFESEEVWLTGSMDAALDLRPEWPHVLPVDVKGKDNEVIDEMKLGQKTYDDAHYAQVQAYIYLCRKFHEDMGWAEMGLRPAVGGTIYYVSRQRPRNTFEFYVDYDENYVEQGLARLSEWILSFREGTLPSRPKEWRWMEEPCKFCKFKRNCKADYKQEVKELHKSNAIEFAKNLNPSYDYAVLRNNVLERWHEGELRLEAA